MNFLSDFGFIGRSTTFTFQCDQGEYIPSKNNTPWPGLLSLSEAKVAAQSRMGRPFRFAIYLNKCSCLCLFRSSV